MKTEFVLFGKHFNMASQDRRRRLVILIYAGLAVLLFLATCGYANLLLILAFVIVARLLGGRSYKCGLLPPFESGDERERLRRNQAYYVAYKWWDLTLLPALLAVGLKNNQFYQAWHPVLQNFIDNLPYGLLVASGILYYTLPQAILLWTEPDMETDFSSS